VLYPLQDHHPWRAGGWAALTPATCRSLVCTILAHGAGDLLWRSEDGDEPPLERLGPWIDDEYVDGLADHLCCLWNEGACDHTPLHLIAHMSAAHATRLLARGADPHAHPHPTPFEQAVGLHTAQPSEHTAASVVVHACEPFSPTNCHLYPPPARACGRVLQQVGAQLADRYGHALAEVMAQKIAALVVDRGQWQGDSYWSVSIDGVL
jgi:hypothetical protein